MTPSSASSPLQSLPTPSDVSPVQASNVQMTRSQTFPQLSALSVSASLLSEYYPKEADNPSYGLPAPASYGSLSRVTDSTHSASAILPPSMYPLPPPWNPEISEQTTVGSLKSEKSPQSVVTPAPKTDSTSFHTRWPPLQLQNNATAVDENCDTTLTCKTSFADYIPRQAGISTDARNVYTWTGSPNQTSETEVSS
jgi:hypothetical protein